VGLDELLEALASRGPAQLAVVGAVARNAWAPPRATTDLDIAVAADPAVLSELSEVLGGLGYQLVREQQVDPSEALPDILVFRSDQAALRQVDVLVAKTDFERQALERAVDVDLGGQTVRVVSPEDLIVYKLIAFRPRDVEDIRAILRTQSRSERNIDDAHVERWAQFWNVSDRWARLRSQDSRG
jgi:predicted nucleotidyltransferase